MEKAVFKTDNFLLASFLLSEGCVLVSLDKSNPKRVEFVLEETEQRKFLTKKFLSYQALVEPHKLFSAQKDLKQMIYS
jgi:hypothetical protein